MVKTRRNRSAGEPFKCLSAEIIRGPPRKKQKSECSDTSGLVKNFGKNFRLSGRKTQGDAIRSLSNKITKPKEMFNITELHRQLNGNIEKSFVERVMDEMYIPSSGVCLKDVAGNITGKQALREMVLLPNIRPDIFVGLRAPPRGLLLYGPPGNGKTLLARALANEAPNCQFFNISASSLTSKWVGEGEKTVRALFEVAKVVQPSIIFIDEVDSLLSTRKETDDAVWRLKTEFLIALDGITHNPEDRVTLIAATNIPQRLDQAVLRRFQKRIMVPMPSHDNRVELLTNLLKNQPSLITPPQIKQIATKTNGFSGSDLTQLAKDAAMAPVREMTMQQISRVGSIRKLTCEDIYQSMDRVRPSTTAESIRELEQWTRAYGELSPKNT